MLQKNKIQFQEFVTTSVANLKRNGKFIISICLALSAFTLLSLNESCFASSFRDIQDRIQKKDICEIDYSPSKKAAIVNIDCGSAIYVNFKNKKIQNIIKHWPNVFVTWKSENIAHLRGPCGTGCEQSIIFIVPSTKIVCPTHEYRIESLNPNEPPDFYNNDPLLIDPYKKIYVCYAEDNVIQVFQMPKKLQMTIRPPVGSYADEASIQGNHLVIIYRNRHNFAKKIIYPMIKGSTPHKGAL
ncbi:MAG: hypothetical protein P4M12_06700 [Gammaproteobacteria bacterium]|nr:hypothetical protein [Gammaproteobacteria bacterium]